MKITKLTIKFFLIISLFASVALADDGQMGSGNLTDDGQMGGGNKTCSSGVYNQNGICVVQGGFANDEKAVLDFIKGFLSSLLG